MVGGQAVDNLGCSCEGGEKVKTQGADGQATWLNLKTVGVLLVYLH